MLATKGYLESRLPHSNSHVLGTGTWHHFPRPATFGERAKLVLALALGTYSVPKADSAAQDFLKDFAEILGSIVAWDEWTTPRGGIACPQVKYLGHGEFAVSVKRRLITAGNAGGVAGDLSAELRDWLLALNDARGHKYFPKRRLSLGGIARLLSEEYDN